MKKIIFTFIALFIATSSFAQEKTAKINQLLAYNNGDGIFTSILNRNIHNIDQSYHAEFKAAIETAATKYKTEAMKYFAKKYSIADLNAIYAEIQNKSIINRTDKTNGFFREWRGFKGKFQKAFKEIYREYQTK